MTKRFSSVFGVVMAILTITFSIGCPGNPVQPTPATLSVTASATSVVSGGSITFTATNGTSYSWSLSSDWGMLGTGCQSNSASCIVVVRSTTTPGSYGTLVSSGEQTVQATVNVVSPARLHLVSGLSGATVSGATVVPDGAETVFSVGDGWATVKFPESSTFNVAIEAAGHWGPYESKYSPERTDFLLWPITGANTGDAIKQMVFGDSSGYNNPGLTSMRRLDGPVSFYFDANLANNPTVVARYRSAASVLQAVIGFGVTVGSIAPKAGTAGFRVYIDPSLQYQAVTGSVVSRGRITSGYMAFHDLENLVDYVIRHEMGHVFGLYHHMGEGLVGKSVIGALDYSQSEKENMHMMLRVVPGTSAPYNDRSAFTASAQSFSGKVVIGCNFDHQ